MNKIQVVQELMSERELDLFVKKVNITGCLEDCIPGRLEQHNASGQEARSATSAQ